jgi:molecular chaperone GrpE
VTPFGSKAPRGGDGGPPGDRQFEVRDKRRIDPATGELRDLPQPGSAAANPGDPANAGQPVTARLADITVDSHDLAAARQEVAERTADLQRITAEYANYRKRVERDKQLATVAGKVAVVSDLLAVLDDLDRAEAHGDLTGGFKTVADKLTGILQRQGLVHYGAVGDEFDPNVHEAVQFATSADVQHPTVTGVLRLGYTFGERVLRPAVVAVTGPEHPAAEPAAEPAAPDATTDGGDQVADRAPAGDGGTGEADGSPAAGADAVGDERADT